MNSTIQNVKSNFSTLETNLTGPVVKLVRDVGKWSGMIVGSMKDFKGVDLSKNPFLSTASKLDSIASVFFVNKKLVQPAKKLKDSFSQFIRQRTLSSFQNFNKPLKEICGQAKDLVGFAKIFTKVPKSIEKLTKGAKATFDFSDAFCKLIEKGINTKEGSLAGVSLVSAASSLALLAFPAVNAIKITYLIAGAILLGVATQADARDSFTKAS